MKSTLEHFLKLTKSPALLIGNDAVDTFLESCGFLVLSLTVLSTFLFFFFVWYAYTFLGLMPKNIWRNTAYILYVIGLYVQFLGVIMAVYFPDTYVYAGSLVITFLVLYATYAARLTLNLVLRNNPYAGSSPISMTNAVNNLRLFFSRGHTDFFSLFLALQTLLALHPSVFSIMFGISVKLKLGFLVPLLLFFSNISLFLLSSPKVQDFCKRKYGADGLKLLGWNGHWSQIINSVPGGKRAALGTVGLVVAEPVINAAVNSLQSGCNLFADIAYNKSQDIANNLAKDTPGYDPAKYAHVRSEAPKFKLRDHFPSLGSGKRKSDN